MAVNVGQRNVPDTPQNRQLDACTKSMELCIHTIKICANQNIFLPEYREGLTNEIIATSRRIYINVWKANNVLVKTREDWQLRDYLQDQACLECNALLALMQLARTLFHLKGKKVLYWQTLCIDARKLIRAWNASDKGRYSNIGM